MSKFKKTLAGLLVGAALAGTAAGILRSPIDRDSFSVGDVTTRVEIDYEDIADTPYQSILTNTESGGTESLDSRMATADLTVYHMVLIKPTGLNAVRHSLVKLTFYDISPAWLESAIDWVNGGDFYRVNLGTVEKLASGAFAAQLPDRAKYGFYIVTDDGPDGFEPWIADQFNGAGTSFDSAPTK